MVLPLGEQTGRDGIWYTPLIYGFQLGLVAEDSQNWVAEINRIAAKLIIFTTGGNVL